MSAVSRVRAPFEAYLQPRILLMLALGFSSGLPFILVGSTLSLWLRTAHISRTEIGLIAYATLAYTMKVLWAPAVDRIRIPLLDRMLGKRRAWMLVSQIAVAAGIAALALCDPTHNLTPVVIAAALTGFAGATQDISIDAWRIEAAPRKEQGAMAAAYQLGYRLAILAAGAGALYIAQFVSWHVAYLSMAALMGLGILAVVLAPRLEEERQAIAGEQAVDHMSQELGLHGEAAQIFKALYRAIVAPFVDFISHHGWTALIILALIGTYRIPDFVMGVMANPLYIDLGFTPATIGTVVKVFGVWITIGGTIAGGLAVARFGIMRALLIGIIASILGNLVFAWLATQNGNVLALTVAIGAENFAGGFAGTALIAYMSSLTSTAFTATQYALFSSFYALPGGLLKGLSGFAVDWFDAHPAITHIFLGPDSGLPSKTAAYVPFFVMTAAMGIPALLLTLYFLRRGAGPNLRPHAASA
ncbi:MAG TPA: MFS transporter [Rhizomicrobium sp.]|nr:MFS transporter [Rhizomicrobium sp.]